MPFLIALIVAVVAAGAAAQSPPAATARTATLWGAVYDPFGQPAANIAMTLDNSPTDDPVGGIVGAPVLLEVRTDDFGNYRFTDVPPGSYVLAPTVSWARTVKVEAPSGSSTHQDVWLAFEPVHTALFVSDRPEAHEPIPPPQATPNGGSAPSVIGPRWTASPNRQYPEGLDLEGEVVLEGHIAVDGRPAGLRIVAATTPELGRAALTAASRERWEPAQVRGVPVELPLRVTIRYNRRGAFF